MQERGRLRARATRRKVREKITACTPPRSRTETYRVWRSSLLPAMVRNRKAQAFDPNSSAHATVVSCAPLSFPEIPPSSFNFFIFGFGSIASAT